MREMDIYLRSTYISHVKMTGFTFRLYNNRMRIVESKDFAMIEGCSSKYSCKKEPSSHR